MNRLAENQCRRCGRVHEEVLQVVDPEGRWAVAIVQCECGHTWTMIHTAPANYGALRAWVARGCEPEEGPRADVRGASWRQYRLEGVCPLPVSEAS